MKAVDLFAGFGGFTEGATQAGVEVVYAANHWPTAVQVHSMNHPLTEHVCQDLRQADWTKLPAYDLLLASPSCQGNSAASQPRRTAAHDAMRSTAWAVVDCADATNPNNVIVENVPKMREWRLYPLWKEAWVRMGYKVTENIVVASYLGTPQRRTRLFIVATKRAHKITIHAPKVREPAFGPCLDPDAGGWRDVADAAPGGRGRIDAARRRFSRSLVQHTTGHRGISLDDPIRTITCQDHWIYVDGDRFRPLTMREYARGMGFPESYTWPANLSREKTITGIGNAVCPPQAKAIIQQIAA